MRDWLYFDFVNYPFRLFPFRPLYYFSNNVYNILCIILISNFCQNLSMHLFGKMIENLYKLRKHEYSKLEIYDMESYYGKP